jgi:ketosteroid isomerase-like protein
MAAATRSDVQVAERFLDALGRGDWDGIKRLLAPDVHMRALVPTALREEEGAEAVVGRFKFWWAGLSDLRLVESETEPAGRQVRVQYRLEGDDADDGAVVVEQQCFFTVADGAIAKINSVCSGFQQR